MNNEANYCILKTTNAVEVMIISSNNQFIGWQLLAHHRIVTS